MLKSISAAAVAAAFGAPPGAVLYTAAATTGDSVAALQQRLITLNDAAKGIMAGAELAERDLTQDESASLADIYRQFESVEASLDIAQRNNPDDPGMRGFRGSRQIPHAQLPGDQQNQGGTPARSGRRSSVTTLYAQPRGGGMSGGDFSGLGEFLNAVVGASAKGGSVDPRLISNAPTTYGTEGTGSDGGFAVPPDFRAEIMRKIMGEESLYALTDNIPTASNSITVPADTGAPWASTGIQAYWESEAGQKTQSKPKLAELTAKLNKITALVPVSDELLEDAPAMEAYISMKAPEVIGYKINHAIINGTGGGQPLGILNSAGTVIVAAESGQAADTVIYENIVNMWGRLPAESRRHAIWLANADVETQMLRMSFPGSNPPIPVYLPTGGLAATPFSTLLGRPVFSTEAMPVLGDAGDLILADMRKYLTVAKAGGMRQDVSIHVWFDYDLTAFRFVLRMTGRPWWNEPIARTGNQASRAFFVALGERS